MDYIVPTKITTISTILHRISVFHCLKQLYVTKKYPTYMALYTLLQCYLEKKGFKMEISLEKFTEELNLMGITYQSLPNGVSLVMEDVEIAFERILYLNKISKLRSKNEKIYYLDVRIIDLSCSFKKLENFVEENSISQNQFDCLIFLHLVSSVGYVNGLITNNLSEENYSQWMTNIALQVIDSRSVIVANNKLFTRIQSCKLGRLNSKQNMIQWLKDNEIPCNLSMSKAELFELINKCPKNKLESKIERIFKAEGHEFIQLPKSIDDLTLTEIMWSKIHEKLFIKEDLDVCNLKNQIICIINTQPISTWQEWNIDIQNMEKEIRELDKCTEEALDCYLE